MVKRDEVLRAGDTASAIMRCLDTIGHKAREYNEQQAASDLAYVTGWNEGALSFVLSLAEQLTREIRNLATSNKKGGA